MLNECVTMHKEGMIPSLDIELSSICTAANCIYCDSKPHVGTIMRNELSQDIFLKLLKNAHNEGVKWIYTCGLGEPLEDKKFNDLLEFATTHNINISLFTNGIHIKNKGIAQKMKDAGICIILKMDTFECSSFDKILGIKGQAKNIYQALDFLLDAGYGNKEQYTDLAFSIVPTTLSITGIPDVIEFAVKNKIFPSVGELEKSGATLKNNLYKELSVSLFKLKEIKELLDYHFNGDYRRPICPAIITGLHFDNLGNCIVDKNSGLNCKWFMLEEPNVYEIGNYRDDIKILFNNVKEYRKIHFDINAFATQKQSDEYVFGGCGGNLNDIVELTLKCL